VKVSRLLQNFSTPAVSDRSGVRYVNYSDFTPVTHHSLESDLTQIELADVSQPSKYASGLNLQTEVSTVKFV
jgi:hypothetical protein